MIDTPTDDKIRNGGMGLAARLALERKYDEAKKVLTAILKISPKDVQVMNFLAEIFLAESKLAEAKLWLDKVLSLHPDYPKALYNMGVIYTEKKQWSKAIKMYERAISHYPQDSKEEIAAVYQNLGCVLWEDRRRDEALEAWKTCLKYDPKNKHAKRNLKEFTNEYGLPASPVGQAMDDLQAFLHIKIGEYLSRKGKSGFESADEADAIIGEIMNVWNDKIASKYGRKMDQMKVEEKIRLFKGIKAFPDDT